MFYDTWGPSKNLVFYDGRQSRHIAASVLPRRNPKTRVWADKNRGKKMRSLSYKNEPPEWAKNGGILAKSLGKKQPPPPGQAGGQVAGVGVVVVAGGGWW